MHASFFVRLILHFKPRILRILLPPTLKLRRDKWVDTSIFLTTEKHGIHGNIFRRSQSYLLGILDAP